MDLICGHCRSEFKYDPTLVGKALQCAKCRQPISMPALEQLPSDMRDEYFAEIERAQTRDEKKRKKAEDAARQAEDAARREQEELAARRQLQQEDADTAAMAVAAARTERAEARQQHTAGHVAPRLDPAIEAGLMPKDYPALSVLATVFQVVGICCFLGAAVCVLVALASLGKETIGEVIGARSGILFGLGVLVGFWGIVSFAAAEVLKWLIDVRTSITATNLLLQRLLVKSDERRTATLRSSPVDGYQ